MDVPSYVTGKNRNFSLEEQYTGIKWHDGRPVYQKSFQLSTLTAGQNNEMPHGIENLDTIICSAKGYAEQSDGRRRAIPNPATYQGDTSEVISLYMWDATNMTGWVGSAYTGNNTIVGGYITIQYVKNS